MVDRTAGKLEGGQGIVRSVANDGQVASLQLALTALTNARQMP